MGECVCKGGGGGGGVQGGRLFACSVSALFLASPSWIAADETPPGASLLSSEGLRAGGGDEKTLAAMSPTLAPGGRGCVRGALGGRQGGAFGVVWGLFGGCSGVVRGRLGGGVMGGDARASDADDHIAKAAED